ncbi:MAG: HEAT repeat domain-containing protein [Terriglobia bacterium]
MTPQQTADMMSKLDKMDERSRMNLLSQVNRERSEMLGVLLKYLGPDSSSSVQAAAIYLIGRNRLSDGVPELVRRIDFDTGVQPKKAAEPLWERYPAMEALITIGSPSIRPSVELLATDPSEVRRNLAVEVIRYVEGPEVSNFILERALAAESEPKRRDNLSDAIRRLQTLIQQTR